MPFLYHIRKGKKKEKRKRKRAYGASDFLCILSISGAVKQHWGMHNLWTKYDTLAMSKYLQLNIMELLFHLSLFEEQFSPLELYMHKTFHDGCTREVAFILFLLEILFGHFK